MKHALAALLTVTLADAAAAAEVKLVPAASLMPDLKAALGKQIDVRFSESFAKDRLAKPDIDGVLVYDLPEGKICLFGQGKGLEAAEPALSAFANPAGGGDVCVPLAEVSVRMTAEAAPESSSPMPFYATDKASCSWVWRQGREIGLWTETCKFDSGLWDVIYDPARDVFALRVDAGEPYTVLQEFRSKGGAAALLPELKAQGLVVDDPECIMAEAANQPVPDGWTAFQVVPTGKRKQTFDAAVQSEIPEPPCGKFGYAVDSIGFFMVSRERPDRVIYANLGQDGTMIDLASLRFK